MPLMVPILDGYDLAQAGLLPMDVKERQPASPQTPSESLSAEQAQSLRFGFDPMGRVTHVNWTVDGRKLQSNNKQAVSPPFDLHLGHNFSALPFRLIISPKVMNDGKGGSCFKKAKGRGYIHLKCEADPSEVAVSISFIITMGSNEQPLRQSRGPVTHNFVENPLAGLPKVHDEWSFNEVLKADTMTFVVSIDLTPVLH